MKTREEITFMLNDVTLPCPSIDRRGIPLTIADEEALLQYHEERLQVAEALNELLRNNTK